MIAAVSILLVEDDWLIADLVKETLEDGGFAVDAVANGEDAISMLERPEANHRAIIADISLRPSKMTGWDVARRAREIKPELAVVYMSGDHAEQWPAEGVPNSVLIPKPFAPAQVLTAVAQLLNTTSNKPGSA
jgi:DNA-binding response OmpR family regulator